MDQDQKKFFTRRDAVDGHEHPIFKQSTATDRTFVELLNMVFGNHGIASLGTVTKIYRRGTEIPDERSMAAEFFTGGHYRRPMLSIEDPGGAALSDDEFLSEILSRSPQGPNRLYFLLGEVGQGKTAFLSYLLTRLGQRIFSEQNYWFLKFDVFGATGDRAVSSDEIFAAITEKLLALASSPLDPLHLKSERGAFVDELRQGSSTPAQRIQAFVRHYHLSFGRQMLLILDNIDHYYHQNDLESFFPEGRARLRHALETVNKVFSQFVSGASPLNDLGATILFVLRNVTYNALQTSYALYQIDALSSTLHRFYLSRPDWPEVVDGRKSLLEWAIDNIEPAESRKEWLKRSAGLGRTKPRDSLVTSLGKMANYGLRDLMEFFKNFSWLEERAFNPESGGDNEVVPTSDEEGIGRLLMHPPVGIIAYILSKTRLFSQRHVAFPNIYLVDNRSAALEGKALRHSYWLKRLILEYVHHQSTRPGRKIPRAVDEQDVISIFAGKKGYPEELVRAALGSMSLAGASNVLNVISHAVKDETRIKVDGIRLSERGQFLLAHRVFDKFYYLQLIVDDFHLPIPTCVEEYFGFDLDYNYLVERESYTNMALEMIERKARSVRLFVMILQAALQREEVEFGGAFRNLKAAEVSLPNPTLTIKELEIEFQRLSRKWRNFGVQAAIHETNSKQDLIADAIQNVYASDGGVDF